MGADDLTLSKTSINKSVNSGGLYEEADRVKPKKDHTWHFLALTLTLHLFFVAGLLLLGNQYRIIDPNYGYMGLIDGWAVTGVGLFLFAIPASAFTIGFTYIHLTRYGKINRKQDRLVRRGVSVLLLSLCIGWVVYDWVKLIRPDQTFAVARPDTLKQFLGGLMFACYAPTTIMAASVTWIIWREANRVDFSNNLAPLSPDSRETREDVRAIVLLWICLFFVSLISCLLSCVWNWNSMSYFHFDSPWSIIPSTKWTLGPDSTDPNYTDPFLYVKLYEDVLVYFTTIAFAVVVGIVGSYHAPLRRFLHKRIRIPIPNIPSAINLFPHGASIGELLVLSLVVGLHAYWLYFWGFHYDRFKNEAVSMQEKDINWQCWARAFGHFTTLAMSFVLFPVARNSVWESVFGMPFERFVKYHRALGRWTWMLVTTHMALWQTKWMYEGIFWGNMFAYDCLEICPCTNNGGMPCRVWNTTTGDLIYLSNAYHKDNFAVLLANTGYLILTVALVFAQFYRRQYFEAFQYTHQAVIYFFFTALIHAWSHWYYTAAGLILYAFDKMQRTIKAAQPVQVVSLTHQAGTTKLVIKSSSLRDRAYAGQYCFINIKEISIYQWHPFSISQLPDADGNMTFHIKDMGRGTWTGDLALMAQSASDDMNDPEALDRVTPTLSIDGPYGRSGHFTDYERLVLVAGGIGITPLHCVLMQIHAISKENPQLCGQLKHVDMVWVVRSPEVIEPFAPTLLSTLIKTPQSTIVFSLHIYCTGTSRGAQSDMKQSLLLNESKSNGHNPRKSSAPYAQDSVIGRYVRHEKPRLESVFELFKQTDKTGVMVCGPESMITDVSDICFKYQHDFHTETFLF